MHRFSSFALVLLAIGACQGQPTGGSNTTGTAPAAVTASIRQVIQKDTSLSTMHVLVALCDNKYQGIVPVPAAIGNGQNPATNLYWGCAFGISSFFKKSKQWTLVKQYNLDGVVMQRLVFRHTIYTSHYLIADAYNGKDIRQCTIDFLNGCAGRSKDTLAVDGKSLGLLGNARLLTYIGHDGLMDFSLRDNFANTDGKKRAAIILACISKKYFAPHLAQTGAQPLVWSTGLMSPEAYTLHDALEGWLRNESGESIRSRAAKAYSKYQHCSEKAARGLLVTGSQ